LDFDEKCLFLFFINNHDHWPWPWPWPPRELALALALASNSSGLGLGLASKWSGLGLEHAVLEPIPARLAPSHASYRGPELVWATGRLMLLDRGFGTSCLLHCSRLTVSANSEDS